MKKAFLNWSSGKDAAMSLWELRQEKNLAVEKLITTVNTDIGRVSMHGLQEELLRKQALAIGLPLHTIPLSGQVSMKSYDKIMKTETAALVAEGFEVSIFGDIFLEDLRKYREEQLKETGLEAVFPLWKRDTGNVMEEFLQSGFKAITVCVNAKLLDRTFCGRFIDEKFLEDLPEGIDPCGENGEFHTFVFDGPIFKNSVDFRKGEHVLKSYEPSSNTADCFSDKQESWDTEFWYCDLLPN